MFHTVDTRAHQSDEENRRWVKPSHSADALDEKMAGIKLRFQAFGIPGTLFITLCVLGTRGVRNELYSTCYGWDLGNS
jgi:hypothetical protein